MFLIWNFDSNKCLYNDDSVGIFILDHWLNDLAIWLYLFGYGLNCMRMGTQKTSYLLFLFEFPGLNRENLSMI